MWQCMVCTYADTYSIVSISRFVFRYCTFDMLSFCFSVSVVLAHFREQLRRWFQVHSGAGRDQGHDHLTSALERIHQRWNTINCASLLSHNQTCGKQDLCNNCGNCLRVYLCRNKKQYTRTYMCSPPTILGIYIGSQIRDYTRLAHGTFFIFMVDHPYGTGSQVFVWHTLSLTFGSTHTYTVHTNTATNEFDAGLWANQSVSRAVTNDQGVRERCRQALWSNYVTN